MCAKLEISQNIFIKYRSRKKPARSEWTERSGGLTFGGRKRDRGGNPAECHQKVCIGTDSTRRFARLSRTSRTYLRAASCNPQADAKAPKHAGRFPGRQSVELSPQPGSQTLKGSKRQPEVCAYPVFSLGLAIITCQRLALISFKARKDRA